MKIEEELPSRKAGSGQGRLKIWKCPGKRRGERSWRIRKGVYGQNLPRNYGNGVGLENGNFLERMGLGKETKGSVLEILLVSSENVRRENEYLTGSSYRMTGDLGCGEKRIARVLGQGFGGAGGGGARRGGVGSFGGVSGREQVSLYWGLFLGAGVWLAGRLTRQFGVGGGGGRCRIEWERGHGTFKIMGRATTSFALTLTN